MKTGPHPANAIPPTITARLTAAIGIDPRALDPGRLKWILGSRCRHLQLADPAAYAAYLEQTPAELDALIDEVVVQETRFFRDPVVFDHIRVWVAQMATAFPGPLRILSAPCGTGQEAWSLAAMLTAAGLAPARFAIDAVDISLSALEAARRGVYPEHALSHVSPELQHATGTRQHKQWHIHDALRQRVQFERRNLAEPGSLANEQYHLILCRNLFIYLHADARTALAESLAAALVPGGRLVLGTADRVEELSGLFAPLRPAASFAFVHREHSVRTPAPPVKKRMSFPPPGLARRHPLPPAVESPSVVPSTSADLLKLALEHQQRGELARAERRCRQALYLAPDSLPALELLQSLWSLHPNLRARRALRDRILRNQPASPPATPAWEETA